jgi:hypothetical protein
MIKDGLSIARWIAGAALGLAACLQASAEEEHLGKRSDALVSATVVTAAEQEALGLLAMRSNAGGCSASLLNNSWAISASHCLNATDMRTPSGVTLTASWAVGQSVTADYIYRSWGINTQGGTFDFAVLHLQAPMRVSGQTTGYVRELSELSLNDMKEVNVAVYGRGMNVLAANTAAGPQPSSGDGLFRSAVFTVKRIDSNNLLFWFPKGPNGETVGSGDSGGPSFEMSRGIPRIAGVHALCHTDCLAGQQCTAANPWMWVSDISECGDAPVGYIGGAILDIIKQAWNPAQPVQTVQMRHTEAQVQKEMLLGYLDSLPWDYARRAAQFACLNRGFAFGFLDGNHQPGVRYQLRCVSDATGAWFDALPPDIARINDKFRGLAQTGWAQGARAANDLCKNRNPAFVGGLLTGFEAVSQPNGGFYDQKDGVFCFNNSNATWFDATQGELAAIGTPIGDLNATAWTAAGRAATEYCRKKFYPAGGFFNGHQLADKRGVVCLGRNSLVTDGVKATDATSYSAARTQAGDARTGTTSGLSRGALVTQSATAGRAASIASALGAQSPAAPVAAPPAVTTFYAANLDGTLTEYRHANPETGSKADQLPPSSSAWNTYDQIIPAGGNHLYARAANGDLLWFQHDGVNDGANAWRGPVKVGAGWQTFTQLIGGGNGVIYAIAPDGTLMWYRHAGFASGNQNWIGPKKIGTGWNSFKAVFSAGEGVIYAVAQDGKLMVYRHLDPLNGEMRWSGPVQVGTGWGAFAQLFSTGNGVLYGLATDGKLSYYRHLTWNAATPTFKWVGALPAGEGFNPAARIVPLLPLLP